MKIWFLINLFLTFSIITLYSCDDIIEPSIGKSQVKLEAPLTNYLSANYSIGFWWDLVNHALSYHLQIVTPSFNSPGSLVLDTIVTTNRFAFTLNPGMYQWRVMAENGSSQTAFSEVRSFTIQNSSLTQQSVLLSSPTNSFLTNQNSVILKWETLFSAKSYQLEIDTNNFVDTTLLVENQTINGQQYTFTFPKDQVYQWRVRAQNDSTKSEWSSTYAITYDHTPPGQVTLSSPDSGLTVSLPMILQWDLVSNVKSYKLYMYKGDSTSSYNSSFPLLLNTTNYSFNQGNSGDKIYWKVTAIDAAGNEGLASKIWSFVLQ